MSDPCIICVAITGSVPKKSDNPAVPITVSEQIESTQEAFEAGATIAHCHVREDDGTPIVAIDPYGSGMHQRVIVSSDGLAARKAVVDNRSPVRMMITGIIDRMEEEKTA